MSEPAQAVSVAPALWQLGGRLVLDVPELLQAAGLADTEAHRAAVLLAARLLVTGVELYARQVQTPAQPAGAPSWAEVATGPPSASPPGTSPPAPAPGPGAGKRRGSRA